MSDFDEDGRRIPDDDEREAAYDAKRARRLQRCLCGPNEWPGHCPGPRNCPVHGEDLDEDAERELCAAVRKECAS